MLGWAAAASAAQLEVFPGDDLVLRTEALQPGDELILHDGLYQVQRRLSWTVLGTEATPVVIRAAEGAAPIVELTPGKEGTFDGLVLDIQDSAWITIDGVTFQGSVGWDDGEAAFIGVRVRNSTNVTIRNSEITQTPSTLLWLDGTNSGITVEQTRIHDTLGGYGVYVGCYDASCWTSDSVLANNWIHGISGTDDYALWLSHGSQGIAVTDNVIYGSEHRGVYLGSTEFGDQNVFEGNALWDISDLGLVIQGSARVRNNILFNIDGTGVYINDPGRETYGDVVFSFNTVASTADWGVQLLDWYDAPGMVFANNAICNPVGYAVYYPDPGSLEDTATPPTDNMISSNVISGLVDSFERIDLPQGVLPGAGFGDFEDVEGWNFYPSALGSTLVGAADPSGAAFIPPIDFNGLERDGASPEVGAYEWSGESNPGWFIQEGFKELAAEREPIEETIGGGCCAARAEGGSAAALMVPLLGLGALARRRQER
jgi:hypothetical protein